MSSSGARRSSGFHPVPGESIDLLGHQLSFQVHPAAPEHVYAAGGARATVYKLTDQSGQTFGLKVFKKAYRNRFVLRSARHLSRIPNLPGMQAAAREIVAPGDPAVRKYPELEYSVLMPWISGDTWFDILLKTATGKIYLRPDAAARLCSRFLRVMKGLEDSKIAHTDISPGNVMVDVDVPDVQLLDLEDMFLDGQDKPANPNRGTNGYRHSAQDGDGDCWCDAGDRYAAAVMAAEMIILSNPKLSYKASDEGYFAGNRNSPEASERFVEGVKWVHECSPALAGLIRRAWDSPSLAACPSIASLNDAAEAYANALPHKSGPAFVPRELPVRWEPFPTRRERITRRRPWRRARKLWLFLREHQRSIRVALAVCSACAVLLAIWVLRRLFLK